jgi:hypothetical protein
MVVRLQEADSGQEALRKAMVHYRIQKCPQLDHTLKLNIVPYSQPFLQTTK